MSSSWKVGLVALAFTMAPAALAGGRAQPGMVREATTGALPDSIRLRMLLLMAEGNINGAVEYYLLATGATTAPRWLLAMQRAFDKVNQIAGPCQQVADDILEGFKRLGQNPVYIRFVNKNPNELRMGFDIDPSNTLKTLQVSWNGFHVAVKVGERVYDAFTGPAGLKMQEYMVRLINGRVAE